ncbi:MAG: prepilin-type N-terminal cleavage/methylation domain-containing protein [Phycisphaerales bacterium]
MGLWKPITRAAPRAQRRRQRRAFTLLETMMALTIVGIGVLAFVDAQASFHRSNAWSSQAATGMYLANEIRAFCERLPRHDPVTGLTTTGGWGREGNEGAGVIDDVDDLDDLDGVTFRNGGTFRGPIDAFGEVIPQININGTVVMSGGNPVSMEGWSQRVIVEKVDHYNFTTVRGDYYQQAASSSLPAIAVDSFPLRVTVIVEFTPITTGVSQEITRTSWIVPPKTVRPPTP